MMAATNRAGSASAPSQLSHADGRSGLVASQSARSMVLPAPAGPTTRARRTWAPWSSRSSNLGRRTSPGISLGARNFDDGNRGVRGLGSAVTVACGILPRFPLTQTTRLGRRRGHGSQSRAMERYYARQHGLGDRIDIVHPGPVPAMGSPDSG